MSKFSRGDKVRHISCGLEGVVVDPDAYVSLDVTHLIVKWNAASSRSVVKEGDVELVRSDLLW